MPKYAGTPLASDWDRLQKRRAVMDAITQQSMSPYGGTERVSGRAVPYSWGTGVGQLGKALIGKYGQKKVAEEEQALGQQYSEQRQKSMDRVIGALQGTPEQPYELSQEEQFEGEQIPGLKTAGVEPDPQSAAIMLGADPYLQESGMATQMLKNQAAAAKGASGGYPSYEPISTPQGIRVFDRRGGGFLTQDEVVRRSRDDVELQAALSGAKGYAGQMGTGRAEAITDPLTKRATTQAQMDVELGMKPQIAAATDLAKREAEKIITRPKIESGLSAGAAKTDLLGDQIEKAKSQSTGWTTGIAGALTKGIPGTPAHNLASTLDTIRGNIGFDKLAEMKANSPTGGALGQVSDFENKLLQTLWGNLEQSQTREQFEENLDLVKQQADQSWERVKAAYEQDYGKPYEEAKQQDVAQPEGVPEGVPPELWPIMTPEERAAWQ